MSKSGTRRPGGKSSTPVPPRQGKKAGSGKAIVAPNARTPARAARPAPGPRSRQVRQASRRRNRFLAAGAVVVVVAVIVVLVVVKLSSNSNGGAPRQPLDATTASRLTSIPVSTLVAASTKVKSLEPATAISQPPLGGSKPPPAGTGGKPEMLYIGAEFCPICATERWAMIVALSQFGKFTHVSRTHSAVSDGNIPTLSFYKSTFTSPYLVFRSVEQTTNQPSGNFYKPLEQPTAAENALWTNNSQGGTQSYPFIDINGKYLIQTSQFPDTTLQGKSFDTIAASIGDNTNTIGADVDASAAVQTREICEVTGQKPAAVCSAVSGVSIPKSAGSNGSSKAK